MNEDYFQQDILPTGTTQSVPIHKNRNVSNRFTIGLLNFNSDSGAGMTILLPANPSSCEKNDTHERSVLILQLMLAYC